MKDKKYIWIIVAIIIIFAVVFLLGRSAPSPELEGPVKIGIVLPLTGGAASIGETARDIINIAGDEINSSGGVGGYDIEFVFEDGACEGATAANATQKLVNVDKLTIVSGIICSGEASASIPIVDRAEGFLLGMTPSSPDLTGVSENFARMTASDAGQAGALAEYANKHYKSIGILNEETDYAIANKQFFVDSFAGDVFEESFTNMTTDVRTNISKLKSKNVDAIFVIVQTPATADLVLNQLSSVGIDSDLLVDVVVASSPDIVSKFSDLLTGSYSAHLEVHETDKVNNLREQYRSLRGKNIEYEAYMLAVYDSVYVLADAVEQYGYDPKGVAKYVYSIKDREGLSGSITIDKNGDRVGGYVLKKYNGTEFEEVKE